MSADDKRAKEFRDHLWQHVIDIALTVLMCLLAIVAVFVATHLAHGSPDSDAAAAIAIAQAMKVKATIVKDDPYIAICRRAVREKRTLVVTVGINRADVPGLLNIHLYVLDGYKSGDIVVCSPDGKGWLKVDRVLPATATDREIMGLGAGFVRPVSFRQDCST